MGTRLGDLLVRARRERGLTLREVEELTGIHNAHLSQIERGVIERPHLSLLLEMASLYELEFGELAALAGHADEQRSLPPRSPKWAALRAVGDLTDQQQTETLDFLARLRATPRRARPALDPSVRRRIRIMAEQVLEAADIPDGPTPLESLGAVVGVKRQRDVTDMPEAIAGSKPATWKRILGGVSFQDRTIYVSQDQTSGRARFTHAHEIAHMMLPWHQKSFRLDDERNLFFDTRDELEAEANLAAAHLLFQSDRYFERALNKPGSIDTPIELAAHFGGSQTASIRYYVEHHPKAVGMLIAGRFPQHDGSLPIWNSIESDAFREQHGRLASHIPAGALSIEEPGESTLSRLAVAALTQPLSIAHAGVHLADAGGDHRRFFAETYFNKYSVFLVVHRGVRPKGLTYRPIALPRPAR